MQHQSKSSGSWLVRRALVGLPFAFLLAWLAFAPSSSATRWNLIRTAIQQGFIGRLPMGNDKSLRESVAWLAPYAGVYDPIVVNGDPVPGRLHVYATSPGAYAATRCARGNALYDAALDTIFIDERLLNPSALAVAAPSEDGDGGHTKDLSFVSVYFRFILLHELGHRKLHRHSKGIFDLSKPSRMMEREADDFAIGALRAAYRDDLRKKGGHVNATLGKLAHLERDSFADEERIWVDIVAMAAKMSDALIFADTDFSAFYHDLGHPTFVDRAQSMLELAMRTPGVEPDLKANARYYIESLSRLRSFASAPYTELRFSEGVRFCGFTAEGLRVIGDEGGIFSVPRGTLDSMVSTGSRTFMSVERDPSRTGQIRSATDRILELVEGNASASRFLESPQPSEYSVLDKGDSFSVLKGGSVVGAESWASVRESVSRKCKLSSLRLDIGTLNGRTMYLTIYDVSNPDHAQMSGVAEYDLQTMSVKGSTRFRMEYDGGSEASSLRYDRLVAVPQGRETCFYLCTRSQREFLVYELSKGRPLRRVTSHPLILESILGIPGGTSAGIGAFDPVIQRVAWVPPNEIVAQYSKDSYYSVSIAGKKCAPVFYPASGTEVAVSRRGQMAFFKQHGFKVYMLATEPANR